MNYLLILLLVFAGLIALYQLLPYWASYKARGKKAQHLQELVADSVLQKPRYVIYFWSPHCGMCRSMTPVVEALMKHYDNLAMLDASKALQAAHALGVSATPALVVIENDVIAKVVLGARSESKIIELLEPEKSLF